MRSGMIRGEKKRKESEQNAFEVLVLGASGGPNETDLSGYLVKLVDDRWQDGFLALEGGSGLGALISLLSNSGTRATLFPSLEFPPTHPTPLLRAGYIFSFLTAYILTHAHLDHCMSLALASGSLPEATTPSEVTSSPGRAFRTPVYGTQTTLEKLSSVYNGDLWPQLGQWSGDEEQKPPTPPATSRPEEMGTGTRKRKRELTPALDPPELLPGCGVQYCPLAPGPLYTYVLPSQSLSAAPYPVAHGATTNGVYESSAFFIRAEHHASSHSHPRPEFLFWGDTESAVDGPNGVVWAQAAQKFKEGVLRAVFIECSYTSSRPANRMFGHLSPTLVMQELGRFAELVGSDKKPLQGLRVFITHIKDSLYPHPSGKTVKERVKEELDDLEESKQLGVVFHIVYQGQRLLF